MIDVFMPLHILYFIDMCSCILLAHRNRFKVNFGLNSNRSAIYTRFENLKRNSLFPLRPWAETQLTSEPAQPASPYAFLPRGLTQGPAAGSTRPS
jgi:hypothetical protein